MEPKATHEIAVPPNLLTGLYQLRTGWYPAGEPGNRLAVVDAGSTQAEANSILIAEIEISR